MTAEQVTGMNYFSHQFLREEDFKTAQRYHVDRLRQHNRLLHTQGVVEGLVVQKVAGTKVRVTFGKAVDGEHREVELADGTTVLLAMPEHIDPALSTQTIIATATGLELELKDIGGSGEVFIAITHNEQEGVRSTDPGIEGKPTRIIEGAKIIAGTTAPSGASILLAQLQRNDDRTIKGEPLDQRIFATARLGPKAVTGDQLADKAIRTNHIDNKAVTGAQIADKAVSAGHLETSLLQQIQAGGQKSGWMRLAFLPKKLGTEPEFSHRITHSASESGRAVGVMEIPVPPGVRRVTKLQIHGTANEGVIRLDFHRAGVNIEDSILLFTGTEIINPTTGAFEPEFGIKPEKQKLDPTVHGLALKVEASAAARIFLIKVEFAYTDE